MKWIALTGGIASGKTTVADGLRSRGFSVIDADQLARDVVKPGSEGLAKIAQAFGPEMISASGELNRKKLGELIFAQPDQRRVLEQITHPLIRDRAQEERQRLEREGQKIAFYDVPLLFEKKMESMFDAIVLVLSHEKTQRRRLFERNQLTAKDVDLRLASQLPLKDKAAKSHFVVTNEGSLADLDAAIDGLILDLKKKFSI